MTAIHPLPIYKTYYTRLEIDEVDDRLWSIDLGVGGERGRFGREEVESRVVENEGPVQWQQ